MVVKYRISSNNSRGDYFYFRTKKGRLLKGRQFFEGGDYFKYSLRRSCPKYFVLLYQAIKVKAKYTNITIEKTVKNRCFCNHSVVNKLNESLLVTQDVNF